LFDGRDFSTRPVIKDTTAGLERDRGHGSPSAPLGVRGSPRGDSLPAARFHAHAAAPTAANPTIPRFSQRLAGGWERSPASSWRYASTSPAGAGGRGLSRRSGAGIQRLMYANDSELQTGHVWLS
jgi:hypothetical protein